MVENKETQTEWETVAGIFVDRNPSDDKLEKKNVFDWDIWTRDPSEFEWSYDRMETCYILEGEATIKTDDGEITIGEGDFVEFPAGLECTWEVHDPIRKHFTITESSV